MFVTKTEFRTGSEVVSCLYSNWWGSTAVRRWVAAAQFCSRWISDFRKNGLPTLANRTCNLPKWQASFIPVLRDRNRKWINIRKKNPSE